MLHLAAVQREGSDGVHRLAVGGGGLAVVFADTDQAVARRIHHAIGVAQRRFRRDCLRRAPRRDAIQPLVGEIAEEHDPAIHQNGPAAVLVDAGARVERRGVHVAGASVWRAPDNDVAPGLGGTAFRPVYVVAVEYAAA